jgi:hypothetical protein
VNDASRSSAGLHLFSERDRTDPTPAREDESTWAFLDRVDDAAFGRVRTLIERWFAGYPCAHRAALRGDLRSARNVQFHAAWFELYLHALHRCLEFDAVVHPEMDVASTHPDFRLVRDGYPLLLEATVLGAQDRGRDHRRGRAVAAIERVESPNFWFIVSIVKEGSDAPAMRSVRREIAEWLEPLDWDVVWQRQTEAGGPSVAPTREFRTGDWSFALRAVARSPKRRDSGGRNIAAGPSDGGVFDHRARVLTRLEEKARKYGPATEPCDRHAARRDGCGLGRRPGGALWAEHGNLAPAIRCDRRDATR